MASSGTFGYAFVICQFLLDKNPVSTDGKSSQTWESRCKDINEPETDYLTSKSLFVHVRQTPVEYMRNNTPHQHGCHTWSLGRTMTSKGNFLFAPVQTEQWFYDYKQFL